MPKKKNTNFLCKKKKTLKFKFFFLTEKNKIQPEKKYENLPEKTSECPRRFRLKLAGKIFATREKKKKSTNKLILGHFSIFSGKKKKYCKH